MRVNFSLEAALQDFTRVTCAVSHINVGVGFVRNDDVSKITHLLADVGVKIESEAAADVFLSSNCKVEKKDDAWLVKIPAYIVENCIRQAPGQVVLKGRTAEHDYAVEPKSVSFTTFGECTRIIDMNTVHITEEKIVGDIILINTI